MLYFVTESLHFNSNVSHFQKDQLVNRASYQEESTKLTLIINSPSPRWFLSHISESLFSSLAKWIYCLLGPLNSFFPRRSIVAELTLGTELGFHWLLQCRSNRTGSSVDVLRIPKKRRNKSTKKASCQKTTFDSSFNKFITKSIINNAIACGDDDPQMILEKPSEFRFEGCWRRSHN